VTEWPKGYNWVRNSEGDLGAVWCVAGDGETCMAENVPNDPGAYLSRREGELHEGQRDIYEERLTFGVAKEQARKDLCLSTYTRYYWQNDLHNTLHYLSLRMDSHAQWEIRQYANVIFDILKQLYPVTCQAFLDYRLNAMTLTALDKVVIQNIAKSAYFDPAKLSPPESMSPGAAARHPQGLAPGYPVSVQAFMAAQHPDWVDIKKCRERDECLTKLQALGLVAQE
jgi:thymidylate synthase (FAD)